MKYKNVFLLLAATILICFINNILFTYRVNEISIMLDLVAQNTTERLDCAQEIVELAANTAEVSSEDSHKAESFLKNIVDNNSDVWEFFLMTDFKGDIFVHTGGKSHYGKSIAQRDYFKTPYSLQQTIIAQPIHSVSTESAIIAIGTPSYDSNSNFDSILVGFVNLKYISDIINHTHLTKNSYQFLCSADGTIAAHPNEDYILNYNIKNTYYHNLYDNIINKKAGNTVAVFNNGYHYIAVTPLENKALSVVTVIPFNEAFYNILILDIIFLFVLVISILLAIINTKLQLSKKRTEVITLQSETDTLTKLKNRRWLEKFDVDTFCEKYFAVVFFDVDNSKEFNDAHNHNYGDDVLKYIGASLAECTRPGSDIGVRYAGDEFLIVFKDTTIEVANIVAMRLMKELSEYKNMHNKPDPISISCGISIGYKNKDSFASIVEKADNAVYKAKESGKNCIVIAQ